MMAPTSPTGTSFPVDALPEWVGEQVAAVAEFTQTPPDLAGCVALATLSASAGGRARVQSGTPPHLRMRVDRLVWQVCDQQSWRAIGDAWFAAQRHLEE